MKLLSFVWAADLAGQGYGRNPNFEITTVDGKTVKGGYVVFDTMESLKPDLTLFQGDMIYEDNAIPVSIDYANGTVELGTWANTLTKDFVVVTLDDFCAKWKYNFCDKKMQSFLAKTPVFVQWDDHIVTNNWWSGEIVGARLYQDGASVNRWHIS